MRFSSTMILAVFTALLLAGGCTRSPGGNLEGSRPNIIFILADDLGWADLPVYGNPFNEAPHLTRMAEGGIRFTNAYAACPVCSPTRASIISGQYPARVGITDFITGHWRPFEEVTVPMNRTQYLPLELHTLGEVMKEAGYATGYFGKWHLGDNEYYPYNQGFDEVNIYQGGGYFDFAARMSTPLKSEPGRVLSSVLTDLSLGFIEAHQGEPFFLFLAHYDVHVQLDADSLLINKYLARERAEDYPSNAIYAAMVEQLDLSTGRILQRVDSLGLSARTLVVFFSDNGGLVSRFDGMPLLAESKQHMYHEDTLLYVASSNAPLRAEKGTLYEGGIREPLIFWWPGTLPEGTVSDALVSSVDFLPTFAALAGIDLPSNQAFDGEPMLPLPEGDQAESDRSLYWHYPVYHHHVPASAIRRGKWKLIHDLVRDTLALYNLEEDIGETNNLTRMEPVVTEELYRSLENWRRETGAELPQPNPGFDPERRFEWGRHPDQNQY